MLLHQMAVIETYWKKQVDTYISITLVTEQYKEEEKLLVFNSQPNSETQKSYIPFCQ